jgi:4-alpha-glucanotransferase
VLLPIASSGSSPEAFLAETGNQWVAPVMLPEDLELQAFAPMETRLEFNTSDIVAVGCKNQFARRLFFLSNL